MPIPKKKLLGPDSWYSIVTLVFLTYITYVLIRLSWPKLEQGFALIISIFIAMIVVVIGEVIVGVISRWMDRNYPP